VLPIIGEERRLRIPLLGESAQRNQTVACNAILGSGSLMTIFSVYFDDSGTHPESDIAVAACLVGTCDQWERNEQEWRDAERIFSFEKFGLSDVLGGKDVYRNWPEHKRHELIRRMLGLTKLRARHGAVFAVIKRDYDEVMSERLKDKVGRFHYSFVVRACLQEIMHWRSDFNVLEPLQYVFDRMSQGKGEIDAILEELISDGDGDAFGLEKGGWSFQNKDVIRPLRGADILATASYRHAVARITGKPVDDFGREVVLGMGATIRNGTYSRKVLRKIANGSSDEFNRRGWGKPLTNAKGPLRKGKVNEEI
jgi:hypothetical protein